MGSLQVIGKFLVSSYNNYQLESLLALNIVRLIESKSEGDTDQQGKSKAEQRKSEFQEKYFDSKEDPKRKNLLANLVKNFSLDKKFEPKSFCMSFL